MRQYLCWIKMLCKRLLHKPFFLLTLLLIPLTVLLLSLSLDRGEAAIKVLLYTDAEPDASSIQVMKELTETSNSTITFAICDSEKMIENEILAGRADCGYVFPADLEKALELFEKRGTPALTAYHTAEDATSSLVQEIIFGSVYDHFCFTVLDTHVTKQTGIHASDRLATLNGNRKEEKSFFDFQYADGTENTILNSKDPNYLLLPIRGIAAVFLFLSILTGGIFWYEDKENKLFCWLQPTREPFIRLLYLLIPGLLAGVTGFFSICLSGMGTFSLHELLSMGLFLFASIGFCWFLYGRFPKRAGFLACIPLFAGGSLLFSPIFLDLGTYSPACKVLSHITPVTYYLNSIHSASYRWLSLGFGWILFVAGSLLSLLQRSRH